MDWFYDHCACAQFKRPEGSLNFTQFCLITHVWLKSKWRRLKSEDSQWLMEELYRRAQGCRDSELGLLMDCTRLAHKRGFILNSNKLISFLVEKRIGQVQAPSLLLIEGFLKLLLVTKADCDLGWIERDLISAREIPDFLDDYAFVENENLSLSLKVHILRKYMLLRDPFRLGPHDFIRLFIDSEGELIKALHGMLKADQSRFIKFYAELVEFMDVDVLVSDAPVNVDFFSFLSASKLKFPRPVKDFHILLRLKCELESDSHPLLPFLEF